MRSGLKAKLSVIHVYKDNEGDINRWYFDVFMLFVLPVTQVCLIKRNSLQHTLF